MDNEQRAHDLAIATLQYDINKAGNSVEMDDNQLKWYIKQYQYYLKKYQYLVSQHCDFE